jgi:glutathione S-transferase
MKSMEPILIYGFPVGSSMGLVAALEWLRQPYRLCRVDMLGEMREPSYARINPRHETPAFVNDKGKVLTENMAIAAWLEARDRERRISFDPLSSEADRMHQLMAFVNTGFTGAFSPLFAAMEMEAPDPAMQSALQAYGRDRVNERHDKLEDMIGETPFLVGQQPTLADALFIGVARWLDFLSVADKSRWPKLAALRQRLDADPAVIYATAVENGEHQPGTGACLGHVALKDVIEQFGT